jgi:6-phosphogluconolactonase
VLRETKRLVAAPWVEKLNTYRITMTLPLLNNGAAVVFLVNGAEKAEIVKRVIEGPKQYPAQAVQPTHGQLLWMLDKAAAEFLTQRRKDAKKGEKCYPRIPLSPLLV